MNQKISFRTFTLWLLLAFLLGSCTWLRSLREEPAYEEPDETIDAMQLQDKLINSNLDYEWINSRTSIRFRSPSTSVSGTGRLTLVKDSLIWGTANAALGIEIARFAITPDSVRIINRYERTYTSRPFAYLQKQSGHSELTFNELQEILAGNYPYDINPDFNSRVDSAFHQLYSEAPHEQIRVNVFPGTFKPAGYEITREASNQRLSVSYDEHKETDDRFFPGRLTIVAFIPQRIEIVVNYQNVNFEPANNLNFDVPDSYERIR